MERNDRRSESGRQSRIDALPSPGLKPYLVAMDLKPHEIVLAVLAVAVPVVVLTLAFIPGGLDFVFDIALDRVWGPVVFFGGAAILFGVLAWRIYRRIRPAPKKEPPKAAPHVSPTRMPKVDGSAAVERLKNRKPQA
jgi:hypothetical protein